MNINIVRKVVLDTETTGMNKFGIHYKGHRIIEIGAVEIVDRYLTGKKFHAYLQPDRDVDFEAFQIHGISNTFLRDKLNFSSIVDEFLFFIKESVLIIHNAPFDLGFLNQELEILEVDTKKIESYCTVVDSLKLARQMFPGQRNSLDALCERYFINRNKRNLHNALIDAQLLANVFLSMTGGQTKIQFFDEADTKRSSDLVNNTNKLHDKACVDSTTKLKIISANAEEKLAHENCLDIIQKMSKDCLWRKSNK